MTSYLRRALYLLAIRRAASELSGGCRVDARAKRWAAKGASAPGAWAQISRTVGEIPHWVGWLLCRLGGVRLRLGGEQHQAQRRDRIEIAGRDGDPATQLGVLPSLASLHWRSRAGCNERRESGSNS